MNIGDVNHINTTHLQPKVLKVPKPHHVEIWNIPNWKIFKVKIATLLFSPLFHCQEASLPLEDHIRNWKNNKCGEGETLSHRDTLFGIVNDGVTRGGGLTMFWMGNDRSTLFNMLEWGGTWNYVLIIWSQYGQFVSWLNIKIKMGASQIRKDITTSAESCLMFNFNSGSWQVLVHLSVDILCWSLPLIVLV